MKFIISTIMLYFLVSTCLGQDLIYSGRVIDSTRNPVQYANVIAMKTSDQSIGAFAVSDAEGTFKLTLKKNQEYLLKVSFVGFRMYEQLFTTGQEDVSNLLVELFQSADLLNEVQVVHEMPVVMSGDTLVYRTEAFVNGRERKLGDVLNKLPGIEVDENGEVKVQGKKVDKLLVDGKPFFDGDTKMGVKNIPASAIDKVQVLKDYNEIGPMNGLQGEESLALNITLREGKKNMVFGDVSLAAGPESRYLTHINSFYYAPKFNLNLIADANNIGEVPFTRQDYRRFSGGLNSVGKQSNINFELSDAIDGVPTASRENAFDLHSKFGALNFNYKPSSKWSHNGFLIGSLADNLFGNFQKRKYLQIDSLSNELLTSETSTHTESALFKYSASYVPSFKTYIKYNSLVKFSGLRATGDLLSIRADSSRWLDSKQDQTYTITQQISAFHSPNERNVFSLESDVKWQKRKPSMTLNSQNKPFEYLLPLQTANDYQLIQNQSIYENSVNAIFNYYRILNNKHHVNLTAGGSYSDQRMQSDIQQQIDGEAQSNLSGEEFRNDINRQLSDAYFGLSSKSKIGPLVIVPGVYFHQFQLNTSGLQDGEISYFHDFLPNLRVKWNISTPQSLNVSYKQALQFPTIDQLAEGLIVKDYNSLFEGDSHLSNGVYHQWNFSYNYFNFFAGMNMFSLLNYSQKKNDMGSQTQFQGTDRLNSLRNLAGANTLSSGMFSLDKRFKIFKVSASANLNSYENQVSINEEESTNKSISQTYKGSLSTTFFKQFDVTMAYELQFNTYGSGVAKNSFQNQQPWLGINWTVFKDFNLISNWKFNNYTNQGTGQTSQYQLWDANLKYHRAGTAWDFSLSAYNLLDARGVRRDSFNENFISSYEYLIQKRYAVFSVKYNL